EMTKSPENKALFSFLPNALSFLLGAQTIEKSLGGLGHSGRGGLVPLGDRSRRRCDNRKPQGEKKAKHFHGRISLSVHVPSSSQALERPSEGFLRSPIRAQHLAAVGRACGPPGVAAHAHGAETYAAVAQSGVDAGVVIGRRQGFIAGRVAI